MPRTGHLATLRPARPGEVRNPTGRNQYSHRRDLEAAIDVLLEGRPATEELEQLGLPPFALRLVPEDATRAQVAAAVMVATAMRGDSRFLRDALVREARAVVRG